MSINKEKSNTKIEPYINKWSELVKKSCFNDIEKNNKIIHTKGGNIYCKERSLYLENYISYKHTKNLCSLAGEIIRRDGVSYLIIDFLRQMLFLRGYYTLTKENVLMQLTKYSLYMNLVEEGMNDIYNSFNNELSSIIQRIRENRRRILIYNIRKVLGSGIGLKYEKQPAYYIRIVDLHLKTTLSFATINELRQLLVWELDKVIYSFSEISVKEKSYISHITLTLDFSNMEVYSCRVEFQSFMRLVDEIIDFYCPLIINTIIIHKINSLNENLWYSIEPIISKLYDKDILCVFTNNENELWDLLKPINKAILHSRGGFIENSCLYPVCSNSKAIPNIDLCINNDIDNLSQNNNILTYKGFFLSLRPELSMKKFINNCLSIEASIINRSHWIEEQKELHDDVFDDFNNDPN